MTDKPKGLYDKFIVDRVDGESRHGHKHYRCDYFVLDMTHDPHAQSAIEAYILSCSEDFPDLARDLIAKYIERQ